MSVAAFGYASLRSDKLDDWADYGPKFLGLQLVERTRASLKFPDGRPQAADRGVLRGGGPRRIRLGGGGRPNSTLEGNYAVGVGTCAWWDGVRRGV